MLCVCLGVLSAEHAFARTPEVAADELLDRVVAQLPSKHIQASGSLYVRRRRGVPRRTYAFRLDAQWQPPNPTVTYTIQDEEQNTVESLTFRPNQESTFTYYRGHDREEATLPDLTANIAETDISWLDLSLSFLWWRGAEYVGEDTVRGFHCHVIEVAAPADIPYTSYAKVRLWISSEQGLLLQAQGFDDESRPIRRFWVQSVREIEETWMIQTLEVQQAGSDQRTRMRIDDIDINESTDL